jgi:PPOX class probable F420-dependent enzyme
LNVIDTSTDFGLRVSGELETEQIVWLTTVRADGTPQPSPVWFLWTGGEVLVLSEPGKPKLRNIAGNPRVALNFNSDHGGSRVTTLSGTARLDDAALTEAELAAYVAKYRDAIAGLGSTTDQFLAAYSVPFRVTPGKLRGF